MSAKSTTRWEYPHSLSYHATTFTISSPITRVRAESTVDETSEHLKSTDTRGSSVTANTPYSPTSQFITLQLLLHRKEFKDTKHTFNSPAAASRKAWLTSSAKVFLEVWTTKSTIDTLGVGTRRAIPLSLPFNCKVGKGCRESVLREETMQNVQV